MRPVRCRRVAGLGRRGQRNRMLGTSRLLAIGVFLVGVLLGASVCGAGNPSSYALAAIDQPIGCPSLQGR